MTCDSLQGLELVMRGIKPIPGAIANSAVFGTRVGRRPSPHLRRLVPGKRRRRRGVTTSYTCEPVGNRWNGSLIGCV